MKFKITYNENSTNTNCTEIVEGEDMHKALCGFLLKHGNVLYLKVESVEE